MMSYKASVSFQDTEGVAGERRPVLHDVEWRAGEEGRPELFRVCATDPTHAARQIEEAPEFFIKTLQVAANWRNANKDAAPVVFEGYVSESPGFCGCIEIILRNHHMLQVLTSPQPSPNCFLFAMVFQKPFPTVSSVEKMSAKYAEELWGVMNAQMREYFLGSVEYLNLPRIRRVNFSDRTHGYLMLGGEPNYVILMQISPAGKLIRHEGVECVRSGKIFDRCTAENSVGS